MQNLLLGRASCMSVLRGCPKISGAPDCAETEEVSGMPGREMEGGSKFLVSN